MYLHATLACAKPCAVLATALSEYEQAPSGEYEDARWYLPGPAEDPAHDAQPPTYNKSWHLRSPSQAMALPQCMCATARVPCRSSHMVQVELYQPTQGESSPPMVVISPRMISGLCDASGTFEREVVLARREDLAGGRETALCCLCLITTIFCSFSSAETT